MPFNQDDLDSYAEQWSVIKRFSPWSRQYMAGGVFVSETPPTEFTNLPVILAFSLLDEVLGELASQGLYAVREHAMLGTKMNAAKNLLAWQDFDALEAAKDRRNKLAHQGELIPKDDSLRIIEIIGNELRAFGAIP